jgi:hypothetical protein
MPEPETESVSVHTQGRPFPWFCPNCRRQEVRCATIPYECQRLFSGQPITVVLPALNVPQCANCGELVFTYHTEEQINLAFRAQTDALRNGPGGTAARSS